MTIITKIFAAIAGVVHVLFFVMESLLWNNPDVHGIFQVFSIADADTISVFIKNQGYYNLFLAFGVFTGLALLSRQPIAGRTLVTYVCLVMLGAAIVLMFTVPAMLTGVFVQGLPPLIALISMQFSPRSVKAG